MSSKYCSKKGHHEGRLIEAICLRPECSDDRLLCFYCKHQNHRFHETAYFPKGLPASLQTLNKNSRIEDSNKQRRKIEGKILGIKKGWQTVEQTMSQHIKQIQATVNQVNETLSNTFLADSVLNIKRKLSSEELSASEVEKYVRMINRVNEFQLHNHQKVMMYSKIKERFLRDVFTKAAVQVSKVVEEFTQSSKELNFTSEELERCCDEYFDQEKGDLKKNFNLHDMKGGFFQDEESKIEFLRKFQTKYDEAESHMSELESEPMIDDALCLKQANLECAKNEKITDKTDKNLNSALKENLISSGVSSEISSPNTNGKIFKIVLDKNSLEESEGQILNSDSQSDKIQERNILNIKYKSHSQSYRQNLQSFENNEILCRRKMSLPDEGQSDESDDDVDELGKTKKKVKTSVSVSTPLQNIHGTRSVKKRMSEFWKEVLPDDATSESDSDSESEDSQDTQKQPKKSVKQKNDAVYGSFDFSDVVKRKGIDQKKSKDSKKANDLNKQATKKQQISKQKNKQKSKPATEIDKFTYVEEGFIEIHKKLTKLPDNSCPSKHHTSFIYPNVKIYGHTLDQIYESLLMLDPQVVTKLQIYCDTTTLCLDTECVDVIIQMKKLKSLMVYMTYQMGRTDVKKIIKNLSNLQELVLSEYNKMDEELARLVRDRLPNLKRFFYTIDERNYMQKIEENLQFFIDFKTTSSSLEVIEILAEIPSLETIEIINVNNKIASRIPNVLRKMKNLKQVCIKNTNNSQSNSTDIVAYLASANIKLDVFCAHNTTFREQSLVKIIEKNKNMHTLIINECLQLRNDTMTVLSKNCPNLKQLSLMLIDSINGRQICTFTGLKTLVLRGCWQIDHQFFLKNIHKLSELQFLSVSLNNYWFYDHFMAEVVKLSKLKFLNLGIFFLIKDTTKVSDAGIKDLHKLNQLQTLICGKTEVTFERLIKSLKGPCKNSKNWTIRKLGLSKDESYSKEVETKGQKNKHDLEITEFEAKNLIALGKALPGLTHLSIGGFVNPKKEYFETLTNLKCLFVTKKQLTSETENWLVKKGVYINEDF